MNRAIDKNGNVIRATISFPHNIYDSLEERASQKKGSIAWIVRDAVEFYLSLPMQDVNFSSLDSASGKIQDAGNA